MSAGHLVQGGDECLMSQDGHTTTSGSGSRLGSGSREGVDDYKPPVLTEDLLVKHNREMERQMVSKFKEAKRIGELGFLKEGKTKAMGQSESKRVLVSKNKVKADENTPGTSKRQHLSTIPEHQTKSASHSVHQVILVSDWLILTILISDWLTRRVEDLPRTISDPWPSLTPTSHQTCTPAPALRTLLQVSRLAVVSC